MSQDASVVVGFQLERDSNQQPTKYSPKRWTETNGLQTIPVTSPWMTLLPVDVSGDGSIVLLSDLSASLGFSIDSSNATTVAGQTVTELAPLLGAKYSSAAALSRDGAVIVGSSHFSTDEAAMATQWIDAQPIPLATAEGYESRANHVTAEGDRIAGSWSPVGIDASQIPYNRRAERIEAMRQSEAVLWQAGTPILIEQLLASEFDLSDQLDGWSLTSATHLSANGQVIAGMGIDPDGNQSAWIAVLSVPEPGAGGILLSFACFTLLRNSIFVYRR